MQPLAKECEITEGTLRFRLRKIRRNAQRVWLLPQVMSDEFSLDQQPKAAARGARFTKKSDR